ncbi:MAG: hypothetical protein V1897_13605 [Pseudomonadota bacterium]
MIEKIQLPALYSVAILSQIRQLDFLKTSSIVESVCSDRQSVEAIPEYLISIIPQISGFEANFLCLKSQKRLRAALEKAEQWFSSGVRVCLTKQNEKLKSIIDYCDLVFTFGDIGILNSTLAMIVNSRVSRTISPDTPWVLKTIGLANFAFKNRWTLISSCGTIPYLLVSWLAKGKSAIIILDSPLPLMSDERTRQQFTHEFLNIFDAEKTLFISEFGTGVLPSATQRMRKRDVMAVTLADVLMPCEVRRDGNMEQLIMSERVKGKIMFRDKIRCAQESTTNQVARNSETISEEFKSIVAARPSVPKKTCLENKTKVFPETIHPENDFTDYFFHYTRACFGPWPGQSWADYLYELTENALGSGHEALDTLRRILKERRIRASGRWIRGAHQVVSFTERLPEEFNMICKWRRGLMRKTFEPFGIAVRKTELIKRGAIKASYGSDEHYNNMTEEMKPFFQKSSSSCADWSMEKEWRLLGDLDLDNLNQSDWFAIVPNFKDLNKLVNTFQTEGLRVLVFRNSIHDKTGKLAQSKSNELFTVS